MSNTAWGATYHAGVLFEIARRSYARTAEAASDLSPGQTDALVAVMFATASLEAFINEAGARAGYPPPGSLPDPDVVSRFATVMAEVEEGRGSLELKYQLARLVFTATISTRAGLPIRTLPS